IAAAQTATIRAPADGPCWCVKQRSCRSELRCPSRAAISSFFSRALVAVWGMHREERSCISPDPKSMQAAKKQHPLGENGTLAAWLGAGMGGYDGSRLVFPR